MLCRPLLTSCQQGGVSGARSVAVILRFVGTIYRHADVIRLCLREPGELYTDLAKVQPRHFLVEMFRQHVDFVFVLVLILVV